MASTAAAVSPTLGFAVYGNATSRLKGGPAPPIPHTAYGHTRHNEHGDQGGRADPEKNALLGACTNVIHLTRHVGTELHGIQLAQLTDKQKDELGLLIAERSVVFFRDQDISPQSLLLLGEWYRESGGHPQVAQVPGVPGVTVIGPNFHIHDGSTANFRQPGGASHRNSDQLGVTHSGDAIPDYDRDLTRTNSLTDDKLRFKWTPGTSALWDNRVLTWMTQY